MEWFVGLGLLGFGLVYGLIFRRRFDRPGGLAALAPLSGTFYWFWTAPDFRFGLGFLGGLVILGASFALAAVAPYTAVRSGVVWLLLAGCGGWTVYRLAGDGGAGAAEWARLTPIPIAPVEAAMTRDGRRIWETQDRNLCWATPIPCAPRNIAGQPETSKIRWRPLLGSDLPKAAGDSGAR